MPCHPCHPDNYRQPVPSLFKVPCFRGQVRCSASPLLLWLTQVSYHPPPPPSLCLCSHQALQMPLLYSSRIRAMAQALTYADCFNGVFSLPPTSSFFHSSTWNAGDGGHLPELLIQSPSPAPPQPAFILSNPDSPPGQAAFVAPCIVTLSSPEPHPSPSHPGSPLHALPIQCLQVSSGHLFLEAFLDCHSAWLPCLVLVVPAVPLSQT